MKLMVQMGTLPDWLAATGTVLSFGVIGYGLLRESRLRRLDEARVAKDRRDAEADMARLVSVGYGLAGSGMRVVVRNDGPAPIRRLRYALRDMRNARVVRIPVVPEDPATSDTITAHQSLTVQCVLPENVLDMNTSPDEVDAETEFIDVYGRQWRLTAGSDSLFRLQDGQEAYRVL